MSGPRYACPRCHRVVASPLARVERYLGVLTLEELELCARCVDELRRAGETLHYVGLLA